VVEEHSRVEQVVCRPGFWGDLSRLCQSFRVLKRREAAVLLAPVVRGPWVTLLVADAGVVGSNPIAWQISLVLEDAVHVTVEDRHVGVQVAYGIVVEDLEDTQLGPSIGETLGDQPDLDVRTRKQEVDLSEDQI
jgi:hypothetical protein